ncbi:MAG: glycosyltransferase family 4 protein [Candidatus Lokiarchaeota archaeon]|nr:glycosyltransferase family 4 protein [Candidatus Lokiarchaeota archaeon]
MKKLNICLVSLKIPPDSEDGASKFFRGIFEYLQNQGHSVKLLTAKWNKDLNDPNIIQLDIIRKRFLWVPHFYFGVVKYLRTHNFDIIHANSPKTALPLLFANTKRFITTIHDLGPFETQFTKIPIEKLIIKYIAKKSTNITTCSNIIKKELKYNIRSLDINKIYNLYSAIDIRFKPYPKEANDLREELGIKGKILIYIGRIAHYKGVEDIINAYYLAKKQIPDLNLVIGGLPDFKTQEKYNNWKQKYKDIHFIGFIPNNKIPYYYSLGDIFITYSYASEGFGLTPIEAIACGTPVICSLLPAYREVLEDNAIFVRPKDPQKLSREIINLIENDKKREQLITKAQNFIKKYTWEKVGQKLEEVYQKFII